MPFVTPWRAIPWLEAICGCPVLCADGSLRPGHFVASAAALRDAPIPADVRWIDRMAALIDHHAATLPDDCFISPTILRGPADVLAAMRGQIEFFTDLIDEPSLIQQAASRVTDLFIGVLRHHFSMVESRRGGYVHSYGYWAPWPTVVIQNDAMGMCSPRVYTQLFREHDQRIVAAFGPGVFYHLHATGMAHWRDVLCIDGLAGLELSIESIGPSLHDLTPMIRETLERSRLILCAARRAPDQGHVLRARLGGRSRAATDQAHRGPRPRSGLPWIFTRAHLPADPWRFRRGNPTVQASARGSHRPAGHWL
jgi:hypothetical protein